MKKVLMVFLTVLLFCSTALFAACGKKGGKIKIEIDGGGISGNYNSTASMTPSAANPYPYNTLEKLAEEWNAKNDAYEVVIRKNSMNGSRETIQGLLATQRGPDVIFQVGVTIAEDLGKNYFVKMDDYLNKPNPYVEGNEKWADLYDPQELETTKAPDGSFYSIAIDKNVAGIAYNKDIFEKAGIAKAPETFGEFMEAQDKIAAWAETNKNGIVPFFPRDNWYDIVLEGSLFGGNIDQVDVIRRNGVVDAEELARAVKLGLYSLDDPRFTEYLTLVKEKTKYYPAGYEGYEPVDEFIRGNVAMISVLGQDMMKAFKDEERAKRFEMGAFGYPSVSEEDSEYGGTGIRRGLSGLGTAWWITNSAMKKGTVEAATDFLMYITAPAQNKRMVDDLGLAIPLDTSNGTANELFRPMLEQYNRDLADPDMKVWHIHHSWGILGMEYYSAFVSKTENLIAGTTDIPAVIAELKKTLNSSVSKLIINNGWDVDAWPAA